MLQHIEMGDVMNEITRQTIELINSVQRNEECNIEISKDNKFIIRLNKDNKLRYIGSKYSVQKDIDSFISIINDSNSETIFIVFGLGTGEHIKHLYNSITNSNKIIIIEPSAAIIQETIKLSDYSFILQHERVALCFLNGRIRKYLNDFIEDHRIDNVKIEAFSNYNVIFKDEYEIFTNEINSVKKTKKMGNNTLNTFSHLFFNNFIENVFSLDEFYTVNYLKDIYKDKPAIIVSAGPSLTKNIHLLKEVQDKFIIICGPRTLGILVQNDIKPDFLCEVDPQEEVYNFAKDYIDLEIPLVFMDSASNKLVKEQRGLKIIAANQGMEKHLEEMLGIKVDSLIQGGSVAHFCMGLAVYMGCSIAIFIGQDLAYTNEKFQAEGTYAGEIDELKYRYENNKEEWNKDKNYSLYVKDIYGDKVRTSSVLNSYREEFEDLIDNLSEIKFINSTEGGAHIRGTDVMDLKDSIKLYSPEVLNKNLEEILGSKIAIDEDEFSKKMFGIIDKLEIIRKACEEGLGYSDKMLHFYKDNKKCNINNVLRELDRIDNIINNKEDIGFFAYKVVSAINSVLQNNTFKEKENESERECGIRLAKKSFAIYLSVLVTVEEMLFKIKNNFATADFASTNPYLFNNIEGIKKSDDLNNLSIIVGKYNYNNNFLNIYTEENSHNNTAKYSSTILHKVNDIKTSSIFIEYMQSYNSYVYFTLVDNNIVDFYKEVKNKHKRTEEYNHNKHFLYGFFTGNGEVGVYINYYGTFIRHIIKKLDYYTYNTIIFNFNENKFIVNNESIPVNRYIVHKYFINKNLLILNTSRTIDTKLIIRKSISYEG